MRTRTLAAIAFAMTATMAAPAREVPRFGNFVIGPTNGRIDAAVMFGNEDLITDVCRRMTGTASPACMVRRDGKTTLFVSRPQSWDDPMVCALGHEALHALGAEHR